MRPRTPIRRPNKAMMPRPGVGGGKGTLPVGNASHFMAGGQRGVAGGFGRLAGGADQVMRPFAGILSFLGLAEKLIAPVANGIGNAEPIKNRKFLDNTIGRAMRGIGGGLGKVLGFSSTPLGELAERSNTRGVIQKAADTLGGVHELRDKAFSLSSRSQKRIEQRVQSQKAARDKALSAQGANIRDVLDALDDVNELYKTDPLAAQDVKHQIMSGMSHIEGITKAQKKMVRRYASKTDNLTRAEIRAEFWKNPRQAISERINNTTVEGFVRTGIEVVTVANQAYGDYVAADTGLRALKMLAADVNGKDVSHYAGFLGTMRLFKSGQPPLIVRARKEMLRNVVPRMFVTVVSTFGMGHIRRAVEKINRGGNQMVQGAITSVVYNGINSITDLFRPKYNLAEIYSELRMKEEQHHVAGVNGLDAAQYNRLIAAGFKLVQDNGGVNNARGQILARFYEQKEASVEDVLKDIMGGEEALESRYKEAEALQAQQWEKAQAQEAGGPAADSEQDVQASAQEAQNYWRKRNKPQNKGNTVSDIVKNPKKAADQGYQKIVADQKELAGEAALSGV